MDPTRFRELFTAQAATPCAAALVHQLLGPRGTAYPPQPLDLVGDAGKLAWKLGAAAQGQVRGSCHRRFQSTQAAEGLVAPDNGSPLGQQVLAHRHQGDLELWL